MGSRPFRKLRSILLLITALQRLAAMPGAKSVARLVGPLALAYALIRCEPWLTGLMRTRPGVLPIAMVALAIGIVIARVRRWLIVTLCYGIGLLALRDLQNLAPLPPQVDYVFIEQVYPYGWGFLAVIALAAGAAEALYPSSIWARRCYFGAAALYLGGHGLIALLSHPNYNAAILLITGLFAAGGVFYAPQIVAREELDERDDEDLQALREHAAERQKSLARLEWQEPREDPSRSGPPHRVTRESL